MFKDLKTQAHLKPGQKGTKRLVARYGDALLCVRYRYDKARGVRLKTVEIIVEEKAIPAAPHGDGEIVPVRRVHGKGSPGYAEGRRQQMGPA